MPIFQLPSGKIVYLSVDDILNMTDEDEQFLHGADIGDFPSGPFHGSALHSRRSRKQQDYYNKEGLDYNEDSEDIQIDEKIDLNSLPDEDTLDINF